MTFLFVTIIISFAFVIGMLAVIGFGIDDKWNNLKLRQKEYNQPYKCKCGITSRKHQLQKEHHLECPHCEHRLLEYSDRLDKEGNFPFAPKISKYKVYKILSNKKTFVKLKEEMDRLIEYDKEIEAWENIQLNKLKKLEDEAERIKQEMKEKTNENTKYNFQ